MQFIVRSQLPDTLIRPVAFLDALAPDCLVCAAQAPMGHGARGVCCGGGVCLLLGHASPRAPQGSPDHTPQVAAKEWRSAALPMALTEGMRVLQGHLSILLLGWMTTVAAVGLFRVASSVSVLMPSPCLFAIVGAPVIARLHAQNDRERLQRLLSWLSLGMTGSTVAMSVPFAIWRQPLGWVFGSEFAASNPVLLVLCLSTVTTAFLVSTRTP
ncbi:MAG: hypothetical protein R3E99_08955 [Burkholderiaceae bacterium]